MRTGREEGKREEGKEGRGSGGEKERIRRGEEETRKGG